MVKCQMSTKSTGGPLFLLFNISTYVVLCCRRKWLVTFTWYNSLGWCICGMNKTAKYGASATHNVPKSSAVLFYCCFSFVFVPVSGAWLTDWLASNWQTNMQTRIWSQWQYVIPHFHSLGPNSIPQDNHVWSLEWKSLPWVLTSTQLQYWVQLIMYVPK